MTDGPTDRIPPHLRRFLPEPTPAEKFEAFLAEHADEAESWRVRSSPTDRRTWIGFAIPLGFVVAVIAILGWRVVG